jgi:hypothetical protein
MLVANDSDTAEFNHTSQHLCSNIGTPRMVTEIFDEQFFVPGWSRETCLDCHLRNGETP